MCVISIFQATKRNSVCIGDVLFKIIEINGLILEIVSGSWKHGVVFQKRSPGVMWQTSYPDFLVHRKNNKFLFKHANLNMKMLPTAHTWCRNNFLGNLTLVIKFYARYGFYKYYSFSWIDLVVPLRS